MVALNVKRQRSIENSLPGEGSNPHDLAEIVMPSEVEASLDICVSARMKSRVQTSNAQRLTSNEDAGGGARTHTALRPLDFESSASANSATPAYARQMRQNQF